MRSPCTRAILVLGILFTSQTSEAVRLPRVSTLRQSVGRARERSRAYWERSRAEKSLRKSLARQPKLAAILKRNEKTYGTDRARYQRDAVRQWTLMRVIAGIATAGFVQDVYNAPFVQDLFSDPS